MAGHDNREGMDPRGEDPIAERSRVGKGDLDCELEDPMVDDLEIARIVTYSSLV